MIEFNLLPDVKLEYIKTQRIRRLTFAIALLATVASVALLVLLLGIDGLQKKHLSDLNHDISSETTKLQGEPHINQILTVQNQLGSLTALHAGKPVAPRVFDYLNSLTPVAVSINNFTIDFTMQTISITGGADALSSVNQYIDTLKCTTYTVEGSKSSGNSSNSCGGNNGTPAFSDVVLSSFGVNSNNQDASQAVTYTLTLSYDKTIFDITQKITLTVPNIVTTRSTLQQPTDLFKASPAPATTTSGGGH